MFDRRQQNSVKHHPSVEKNLKILKTQKQKNIHFKKKKIPFLEKL